MAHEAIDILELCNGRDWCLWDHGASDDGKRSTTLWSKMPLISIGFYNGRGGCMERALVQLENEEERREDTHNCQ